MRFAVLLSLAAAFAIASDLPDGKGKDVVETACSDCHSLERIKAERRNEEGWNSLIHEMLENGAAINGNDMPVIVAYLVKNFGPDKKVNKFLNLSEINFLALLWLRMLSKRRYGWWYAYGWWGCRLIRWWWNARRRSCFASLL